MEVTNEFISKEELAKYNALHSAFKRAEAELAYSASKAASAESRYKSSLMNYDNSLSELDDIQSDLTSRYGDKIQIKLDTGEIIRDNATNP